MSVSSTQGKLEVLRRHYEELGKVSVDDNFEADWKDNSQTMPAHGSSHHGWRIIHRQCRLTAAHTTGGE